MLSQTSSPVFPPLFSSKGETQTAQCLATRWSASSHGFWCISFNMGQMVSCSEFLHQWRSMIVQFQACPAQPWRCLSTMSEDQEVSIPLCKLASSWLSFVNPWSDNNSHQLKTSVDGGAMSPSRVQSCCEGSLGGHCVSHTAGYIGAKPRRMRVKFRRVSLTVGNRVQSDTQESCEQP